MPVVRTSHAPRYGWTVQSSKRADRRRSYTQHTSTISPRRRRGRAGRPAASGRLSFHVPRRSAVTQTHRHRCLSLEVDFGRPLDWTTMAEPAPGQRGLDLIDRADVFTTSHATQNRSLRSQSLSFSDLVVNKLKQMQQKQSTQRQKYLKTYKCEI